MFLKFQEFHNGALKIFSEASGFQGLFFIYILSIEFFF